MAIGTDGDRIAIDSAELSRHCYLLGATGCGKTSLILKLIAKDIESGQTVVVLDMRGDLVSGVLGLCHSLGIDPRNVHLIDLREKNRVPGFNPLSGSGEPYIRALRVLELLQSEAESWGVQLEETLRHALILLASAGASLSDIERLFFEPAFRRQLLRSMTDESVLGFWHRFDEFAPDRQITLSQPVLNKVSTLLAVPSLRMMFSSSNPVCLGEILNRPAQVLVVSLAVDELQRSARMVGSLVVSSIAQEIFSRVDTAEDHRVPVRLYVDEFENFASASFESLIAEGRRFKLSLILSHQTLSQISPKLRSVIRNNVGLQILFNVGFEDAQVVQRELPSGTEPGALRGLGIGEAFLMKRDGSAQRVQFDKPGNAVPSGLIEAYRQKLLPERSKPKQEAKQVPVEASRKEVHIPEELL